MENDHITTAAVEIEAAPSDVWAALIDPDAIHEYMFGTNVMSDFRQGSPITWHGEWEGKPYEDKGVILTIEPERTFRYSHFSPLSGQPDVPENYHTVTIDLTGSDGATTVSLEQDHNASEQDKEHSEQNWKMMLGSLKKYVESHPS